MSVVHVIHHSTEAGSLLGPTTPGVRIKSCAQPLPTEPLLSKTVNSCFIGTRLESLLRDELKADTVVCIGLTADHCVNTTTRMAGNLGFTSFIVNDACATFDRVTFDGQIIPAAEVQRVALSSLHNEFATVLNTDDLIKRLPQ